MTEQIKLEIKSLKISAALSEETMAFSAVVYVDGQRAFTVSNRGHGGCHLYCPVSLDKRALLQRARDYAKALPGESFEMGGVIHLLPMDLDQLIDGLVIREAENIRLRKLCKTAIYYRLPDSAPGIYYKFDVLYTPTWAEYIRLKYPGAEIANERF